MMNNFIKKLGIVSKINQFNGESNKISIFRKIFFKFLWLIYQWVQILEFLQEKLKIIWKIKTINYKLINFFKKAKKAT